jgi:hypothetical protein
MLPVLYFHGTDGRVEAAFAAAITSFANDFQIRLRFAGGTGAVAMSLFALEETACVMHPSDVPTIGKLAVSVAMTSEIFAQSWVDLHDEFTPKGWRQSWALTEAERLRTRCILEALCFKQVGITVEEAEFILRDCDHPVTQACDRSFNRVLNAKGFWRVDKEKNPELRHTVLSLVAFDDLQRMGLEAFLAQNDGEGWMLPVTLRLADYGLGHDDRAREPQPVASRLGPRFHPWQLEGTVEESWEECRRHAANLRAIRSIAAPAAPPATDVGTAAAGTTPLATDLLGHPIETDLLGHEVTSRPRRRGGR